MKEAMYKKFFEGKKATIMGLGLLGRGVGDTLFLARQGTLLTVTDKKSEGDLAASLDQLKEYTKIEYRLGEHDKKDFKDRDFILKAAGVPYDSEYTEYAKAHGVPVYMSAALVVKILRENLKNVTVVGVTGTRGKTTTTELIAHILESAGKHVHRGGNIRGVANLPLLEAVEEGEYLVLELDSWQLQGFGDLEISPDIAVFTSFLDDHLNYYKGDRELYFKDKANIFINQQIPCLIASAQAAEEIKKRLPGQQIVIPGVGSYESNIIGTHNDIAISLALEVSEKVGVRREEALTFIKSFRPVSGRLEKLGSFKGITVYNDNNATTPDAVIAGLEAVSTEHATKPILIMGGSDKGLDLLPLEKSVERRAKSHILLSGTGTERLSLSKDRMYETLGECVREAFSIAKEGDVILFSPGFASFSNYFNNEYERNDAFVEEVRKYD